MLLDDMSRPVVSVVLILGGRRRGRYILQLLPHAIRGPPCIIIYV